MGSSGGSKDNYSDVDTHYTKINPDDFTHMVHRSGIYNSGYFQSANSWKINGALRDAVADGISVRASLELEYGDEDELAEAYRTIDAMDKSMLPLNKDIELVRMADNGYLENLITNGGAELDDDVRGRLMDASKGFRKFDENDVAELRRVLLGDFVREHAYMSTTYDTSLTDSEFSYRRVRINIDAKAGTPAIFSPTGMESECVLSRNVGYGINDIQVSADGRQLIISVETVP